MRIKKFLSDYVEKVILGTSILALFIFIATTSSEEDQQTIDELNRLTKEIEEMKDGRGRRHNKELRAYDKEIEGDWEVQYGPTHLQRFAFNRARDVKWVKIDNGRRFQDLLPPALFITSKKDDTERVELKWNEASKVKIKEYVIEKSVGDRESFKILIKVPSTEKRFVDTDVSPKRRYYYRIYSIPQDPLRFGQQKRLSEKYSEKR